MELSNKEVIAFLSFLLFHIPSFRLMIFTLLEWVNTVSLFPTVSTILMSPISPTSELSVSPLLTVLPDALSMRGWRTDKSKLQVFKCISFYHFSTFFQREFWVEKCLHFTIGCKSVQHNYKFTQFTFTHIVYYIVYSLVLSKVPQ